MNEPNTCQSCAMPIESGDYCQHCVDENGSLQSFDERLERLTQCMVSMEQASSRAEAEKKALAYMATMPAWRDHPKVLAALED